jgi:hypothetical protein
MAFPPSNFDEAAFNRCMAMYLTDKQIAETMGISLSLVRRKLRVFYGLPQRITPAMKRGWIANIEAMKAEAIAKMNSPLKPKTKRRCTPKPNAATPQK